MKIKTQAVLGILFLSSFIKSFKYSSNAYDVVFIILIATLYLSYDFIIQKNAKADFDKLTADIDLKLKHVDEEMERVKNSASKVAMMTGFKR